MLKKSFLILSILSLFGCNEDDTHTINNQTPYVEPQIIIIGHRGASALRPEHTLEAYQKAIDDGADFIEPDLVPTKDGFLVARHENDITGTSNISELIQFSDRKTTKNIDGENITGWFTEDFTLNELSQNVRARERIPEYRPNNSQFNDLYPIPTLEQIIELAQKHYQKTGKIIGLYIETKHPSYFQSISLPIEDKLIQTLSKFQYTRDIAPIYIQSFEVENIKYISNLLKKNKSLKHAKIIQLFDNQNSKPADDFPLTYGQMATPEGLKSVAQYADGIGPSKTYIFSNIENKQTSFIQDAHQVGLKVHPYTLRPENDFLPPYFQCSNSKFYRCESGALKEFHQYFNAGVDGIFTDDPSLGRKALSNFSKR